MNMRNYMKKKEKPADALTLTADELIAKVSSKGMTFAPKLFIPVVIALIAIPVIAVSCILSSSNRTVELSEEGLLTMATAPAAVTATKKNLISIPAGTVKANPFLPYRDVSGKKPIVNDVPKYDLLEPPEFVNENSDAAKVMDTVVSGILYDKYSPSAILNIEGNDYLVKKGDVVNNYKVLNIAQDSVTVKLGNNTYKAGIGQILTEGSVNYNHVSNLSKKFGGERR